MNPAIVIPAYDAERTLGAVLDEVLAELAEIDRRAVYVVDDGSTDGTAEVARRAGVTLVAHAENEGKGAALVTGMRAALEAGHDVALTLDADLQHPAKSARIVLEATDDARALVLGVRDLVRDGAPRANQMSNGISNFFLSKFTGKKLADTQCGLRRYPLPRTLALGPRARGFALEAEVILLAVAAGLPIVQVPVPVRYLDPNQRTSHFDPVSDPWRIVAVVLRTVFEGKLHRTSAADVEPTSGS